MMCILYIYGVFIYSVYAFIVICLLIYSEKSTQYKLQIQDFFKLQSGIHYL